MAAILAGAALAVSLMHAGPRGIQGVQGVQGSSGATGPQGPQGSPGPAGNSGTTPYSSYNQVCDNTFTNGTTGVAQLYYFPCTNGVQPVPGQ